MKKTYQWLLSFWCSPQRRSFARTIRYSVASQSAARLPELLLFAYITERFKSKPSLQRALSIAATFPLAHTKHVAPQHREEEPRPVPSSPDPPSSPQGVLKLLRRGLREIGRAVIIGTQHPGFLRVLLRGTTRRTAEGHGNSLEGGTPDGQINILHNRGTALLRQ